MTSEERRKAILNAINKNPAEYLLDLFWFGVLFNIPGFGNYELEHCMAIMRLEGGFHNHLTVNVWDPKRELFVKATYTACDAGLGADGNPEWAFTNLDMSYPYPDGGSETSAAGKAWTMAIGEWGQVANSIEHSGGDEHAWFFSEGVGYARLHPDTVATANSRGWDELKDEIKEVLEVVSLD